jgi:hypothetical protein
MNAPVMVELEGETDPLEVKFFFGFLYILNWIIGTLQINITKFK